MPSSRGDAGRIPVDLRVGVTGHRWIPDDHDTRDVARTVLERLIAAQAQVHLNSTERGVTVVSALAEGADRIVAQVGLDLGARLEVVLPLAPADYTRDFADDASRAEFAELCARAASVRVASADVGREVGYSFAGRAMADRIDVLVAIHDGEPARGAGGTAEIVDYARSLGIPVVDVRARRGHAPAIEPPGSVPDLSSVPLAPDAFRRLDAFNSAPLRASTATDPDHPLRTYYARADQLALRYQRRHRLAILLLYGLSAFGVGVVAFQEVFFEHLYQLGWIEFAALVVVLAVSLFRVALLGRWTSARFIAERLRSAMFLSRVGITPSFASVPGVDEVRPGADWAGRAVRELWFRAAEVRDHDSVAEAKRLADELVQPQINYHQRRHDRWERRQRVTTWLAIALFALSMLSSLAHSLHLLPEDWPDVTLFVSIAVPALAAAISGYAAQREFGRQAMQSGHALRELQRLRAMLTGVQADAEVAPVVIQLDALMHGDAAEWYVSASLHDDKLPG